MLQTSVISGKRTFYNNTFRMFDNWILCWFPRTLAPICCQQISEEFEIQKTIGPNIYLQSIKLNKNCQIFFQISVTQFLVRELSYSIFKNEWSSHISLKTLMKYTTIKTPLERRRHCLCWVAQIKGKI